jgi:predicted membrane channel-forming protein YqfA (hemolysin III family)
MAEPRRNEKEEEKKNEKQEEKKGSWEEKWQRDRVNAVSWASILIWGAIVLLIDISKSASNVTWWHGWAMFLLGAGVIILLTALYRWLRPEHRRPLIGSFILGIILLGVGLGDLVAWSGQIVGIIILVVLAFGILLSAFRRR